MAIDAADMLLVHRVFRRGFGEVPALISSVAPGDRDRARAVSEHLELMSVILHHHHLAEDELVWPKLCDRAPDVADRIHLMEDQHSAITGLIDAMESARLDWMRSPDRDAADRLASTVTALSDAVTEHLDAEERDAVPAIERYISADEWQEMLERGAAFLTPRTVRRALVFGGMTLEATRSPAERQRFLDGLPLGPRMLLKAFASRTLAAHRRRLRGTPCGSS